MDAIIDRIRLYQDDNRKPVGTIWYSVDCETGETNSKREAIKHSGLHGSSIYIAGDRDLLIDLNPSRWNLPTSLFGGADIRHAEQLAIDLATQQGAAIDLQKIYKTRVDICREHVLGNNDNANSLIEKIKYTVLQRGIEAMPHKTGVTFYTKRKRIRVYKKFDEINHQLKENKTWDSETRKAVSKLAHWTKQNGIVRFEVELKSEYLARKNWRDIGKGTQTELEQVLMTEEDEVMPKEIKTVDKDIIDSLPLGAQNVLLKYLNGIEWQHNLKQASIYRYRKLIIDACGIDIRNKLGHIKPELPTKTIFVRPLSECPEVLATKPKFNPLRTVK